MTTALATLDDIPGSNAFSPDQTTAAEVALLRASVAVRAYCRQQFTRNQQTDRLRARDKALILPQRPVISIDAVAILVYGKPTAVTGWIWDGLDHVFVAGFGLIINLPEAVYESVAYGPVVADVTYTSGYDPVPDDVVEVTASVASRSLAIPAGGAFTSQASGPFNYTVATWAQGGPMSISDAEKVVLDQYRNKTASVELRS